MKKSLFEYSEYKAYLIDFLESGKAHGYGSRTKLATHLGCNIAYVSQVLNNNANFSLEQGERINRFIGHGKQESQFFLLLLQKAKSGSIELTERIDEQIGEIHERRLLLKERVDIKKSLSESDQTRYYSAWFYAAVHIIVTIENFQTKDEIATRLGVSLARVTDAMDFLVSIGLVTQSGDHFKPGVSRLFLGSDSLMISKHHTNWRIKAIESLDRGSPEDLHLSTLWTFAKKDLTSIRETLIKAMNDARGLVKDTKKEEEIFCFNLDFFRL